MQKLERVLYITYDGLLEPLGQSQILTYLIKLANDFDITIISFEKPSDWKNIANVKVVKDNIFKSKIKWIHLSYSSKPYVLSTLFDILKGILKSYFIIKKNKINIVHTRSYIPALIAYKLSFFLNFQFIFDMRGFWADERIEWGIWKRKNFLYYFFKFLEKKFYLKSNVVISLTNDAVEEILTENNLEKSKFYVIPTCTNLNLFKSKNHHNEKFILSHIGAVSTRYEFSKVFEFFNILDNILPSEFLVINKGEHKFIKKHFNISNIKISKFKLFEAKYIEVQKYINQSSAGIFFPKEGNYLKAYFPTKLGEYLACGKPIVCGKINQDVEKIINENNVGVIIKNYSKESLILGSKKIINLSLDEDTKDRCRKVAEKYFSVEGGVDTYKKIYLDLKDSI